MNKTLKRRVFRHTALYAAILMFSHTGGGGGGGAMAQTHKYAIIMNERKQPEVKWDGQYQKSQLREKDRERKFIYTNQKHWSGQQSNFISFNNNDTLVSQQSGTAVFGTATYLPPYGKVSGFDTDSLKGRANAAGWIRTTRPGWQATPTPVSVADMPETVPNLPIKPDFPSIIPTWQKQEAGWIGTQSQAAKIRPFTN